MVDIIKHIMKKSRIICLIFLLLFSWKERADKLKERLEKNLPSDWQQIYPSIAICAGVNETFLSGSVNIEREKDGEKVGEKLDLVDDLDLKTPSFGFDLELRLNFGARNRLIFAYEQERYVGELDLLDEDIEFAGKVFTGEIETALLIDIFEIKYQRIFYPVSKFSFGLSGGLENYIIGLMVRSKDLDISATPSLWLPIPTLGISGIYKLGYGFSIYGELKGMGLAGMGEGGWLPVPLQLIISWAGIENFYAYHWSGEMGVKYVFDRFTVELGGFYHQGALKIDYKDENKRDYFKSENIKVILRVGAVF